MAVRFHIHGRGQFDATHRIGPCVWPHFDLLTVHSGKVFIEMLRGERVEVRQKQSVLIYPHTRFEGASITKKSGVYVQHFGLSDAERMHGIAHPLGRLIGRLKGYELYRPNASKALMADIQRAVAMAHRPTTALRQNIREAMLTLILGQLCAECSPPGCHPESADDVTEFAPLMQWVTSNLERQVTLDEMAKFSGYSTSHFRAQFVRHVGHSPGVFLRQSRHLEAARLLRETQTPIKEIARRVGYDDIAHFYRFFTKMARLTPRQYRARYQLRG